MIGTDSSSWMETTVCGKGTFAFMWRVECEEDDSGQTTWDRFVVFTNGVEVSRIDGTKEWSNVTFQSADSGEHTVRWESYVQLSEKIGSVAAYTAFRSWVNSSEFSHDLVKEAPNAWLSYALDAPALMTKATALASEDVVIESIAPSSITVGVFDLVVNIADAEIGEGARLADALGVEGATELNESAFSSEGLSVTLERTTDGKAKATVTSEGAPCSFFLRVRVK